jgi:hypothetical protein
MDIHLEGSTVAGHVHKSEISNRLYVTPELLPVLLPKGGEFAFLVKRFDDQHRVVELSRRRWLTLNFPHLEYGKVYKCKIVPDSRGKVLLYGDELECTIPQASCLSWKWRKRSSVKIMERTYEERA